MPVGLCRLCCGLFSGRGASVRGDVPTDSTDRYDPRILPRIFFAGITVPVCPLCFRAGCAGCSREPICPNPALSGTGSAPDRAVGPHFRSFCGPLRFPSGSGRVVRSRSGLPACRSRPESPAKPPSSPCPHLLRAISEPSPHPGVGSCRGRRWVEAVFSDHSGPRFPDPKVVCSDTFRFRRLFRAEILYLRKIVLI